MSNVKQFNITNVTCMYMFTKMILKVNEIGGSKQNLNRLT